MKVILINPNRYKSPPVPPIGLEYLAASLESKGHAVEIVDLCFSGDPHRDVDDAISSFRPDAAGIALRNVDTVLYHTNEFFLDEIKEIVTRIKMKHGLKTIVGGTGVSSYPHGILEYLDADYAIAGPAEHTVHEVLDAIHGNGTDNRVYRGIYSGVVSCPRRPARIDYKKYFASGGVAGFETHKGCSSSCAYCLEANKRVSFKPIEDVIREIKLFVDSGYDHFHLCDSEFNEDLEYSTEFCHSLKTAGLGIKWAVYMKPMNFSRTLFRLLRDTGVYLVTLTVDSWRKCDIYWADYEKFVFGAKANGIKVAVDFLTGFPYETRENLIEYFDILRRPLPDGVGINTYIRLYKSLQITDIIMKDGAVRKNLLGDTEDSTFLKPVFYNHIDADMLKTLIDGDPLFRVEGIERGVNYGRVTGNG